MSIADATVFFADGAQHRSYRVVDDDILLGLVSRNDALRCQVGDGASDISLADTLSNASLQVAYPETPIGVIADLMVDSGIGRIPIVDTGSHRALGILSRQDPTEGAQRASPIGDRPRAL